MSSSLIHRCQHCGYETEVTGSLSAFSENPHCKQCGLSASEGDTKMQEDLSALFTRNMMVGNHTEYTQNEPSSAWKMTSPFSNPTANPITYSITQHYHHSGHQAPSAPNQQQAKVYPHGHVPLEEILVQNNVDPSSLSLAQLTLVQQADQEQLLQMIEQWRVSPPASTDKSFGTWNRLYAPRETNAHEISTNAEDGVAVSEPTGQDVGMDGMGEDMRNLEVHAGERNAAEPYMVSGYETLAKRDYDIAAGEGSKNTFSPLGSVVGATYEQRTDPAYDSRGWWQHSMSTQPMEHQYGAFEHFNNCNTSASHGRDADGMEDAEML